MENHFSNIYKFFEFVREESVKNDKGVVITTNVYKCLICKRNSKKEKDGSDKVIRASKHVTSNLIRYLECVNHEKEYEEFKMSLSLNVSKKRKFDEQNASPISSPFKKLFDINSGTPNKNTPSKSNLISMGSITKTQKYPRNVFTHLERYN